MNRSARLLLAAAPLAFLIGCGSNPTSTNNNTPPDTAWQQSVNVTSQFGSYTFTNETPAFGDAEVSKIDAEEAGVGVAEPDSARNDSTVVVRIMWGQLRGNPNITAITDWTGTVSVTAGRLAVLRRIGFDPGDHLVFPRPNRQTQGFVSHTVTAADGLVLLVHEPPGAGAVTFNFNTVAYSNSWSLDSLEASNHLVQVDSTGNAVSITARKPSSPGCPAGFTRGHWVTGTLASTAAGVQGFFRGIWLADDGRHAGHIRGHFGVDAQNNLVWFAKIIGRDGHLIGLAHGTWSVDANHLSGSFVGQWFAAQNLLSGTVNCHFVPGRVGAHARFGFFDGSWKTTCAP